MRNERAVLGLLPEDWRVVPLAAVGLSRGLWIHYKPEIAAVAVMGVVSALGAVGIHKMLEPYK